MGIVSSYDPRQSDRDAHSAGYVTVISAPPAAAPAITDAQAGILGRLVELCAEEAMLCEDKRKAAARLRVYEMLDSISLRAHQVLLEHIKPTIRRQGMVPEVHLLTTGRRA